AKRAAGEAAAGLVEAGMVVGLGTGSTTVWFLRALAIRVREGLHTVVVPTSTQTAALALEEGLELAELDRRGVDLAVDGADCVDPDLRLIKGAGGALVREKIVAAAARLFVVIVDSSKLSDQLQGQVPVEVLPFGAERTITALETTGSPFQLRTTATGVPVVSDNGNLIADSQYQTIDDPEGLSARLDAVPGVVGHGLFLGMADLVLVGHTDGTVNRVEPR
ncbi:MAG TPA: ribose-5-phosphate isomerase RpiA, partial [Candidatus Dormibacteraeota bacterium]|nr:ribose-5-phosphate isomerase RpiA [Candidatus Dormibacteraeota bacterium]